MNERELFIAALQKDDPAERQALLDQACGGDAGLRQRVEALLRVAAQAGSFLESPPADIGQTQDTHASPSAGAVIGPYKLIELIGEGGMGTVWMAQQTEPVKRLVALKLIKAGMDSKQVIARFEAERQALALMDHPNIAKVLDAGVVGRPLQADAAPASQPGKADLPLGRPYFVMELVKGISITRYCDAHHLTPRQRLELFISVCHAIQHAHQKGIIHRDLKPSNVLVALYDGKPVPKVIDFGIAKAAGQPLTEQTLVTGFGAIVGTLEYMSPEQAEINQLDIDTRSDIYSLGVLLYELLTGSPPFSKKDLEKAGMLEMLRVIREQEPSKPSTKLSSSDALPTLSANRGTEPAKLTKLVRGELDWIVMKALEKDRNRRYETANGFAMDVQRYLADEQVLACPPSVGYRLRKFARRNKEALVTVALVALALVTGTVVSTWQAVRATEAEGLAQERFEAKKAALEEAEEARKEAVANLQQAREAVDQMLTRVGSEGGMLADEPGMTPVRRALLEDALKFYQRFLKQNSTNPVIRAETGLAAARVGEISVYLFADRARADESFAQAVALLEQAIVDFPAEPKYPHALGRCLNRRAEALTAAGRLEEAEHEHRRALAQFEREGRMPLSPQQERGRRQELAYTYLNLGKALAPAKPKEAEQTFRHLLDLAAELDAEFPNDLIYLRYLAFGSRNLADLLRAKQPQDALPMYRRSAELLKKLAVQFPDHPLGRSLAHEAAKTYSSLGHLLTRLGLADEARATRLEAVGLHQQSASQYEKISPQVRQGKTDYVLSAAREYANLARELSCLGRWQEAITAGRKGVGLKPDEAPLNNILAWILVTCPDVELRDPDQAVARAKRAVQLAPKQGTYWTTLGMAQYRAGEWKASIAALERAMELRKGGNSFEWFFLAMAHWQLGQKDKARAWYDRAVQQMNKSESKNDDLRRFRIEASKLMELKETK